MIRLLCTLSLLIATFTAQAQTNLDSLYDVWQDESQAVTARLDAIHALILEDYLDSDPDSALYFASLQYAFAEQKALKKHMARALRSKGLAYYAQGEQKLAFEHLDESIALFSDIGALGPLANSLVLKANLHMDIGQYDTAYTYFNKTIELYQEQNDSSGVASILLRKANTAENYAEYTEAMEYALEALRISEKLKDPVGTADAYVQLSAILYQQKNYEGSIDYGKKALEFLEQTGSLESAASAYLEIGYSYLILSEYDTALVYMDRALNIRTAIGSSPLNIAKAVNGRGNVYKYLEAYDNAVTDYKRSLAICEEQALDLYASVPIANTGHVYLLMGKYGEALPYIMKSIELQETSDNRMNIAENYMHASTAYEGLGQFDKALKWYQKYDATKDSIFTAEKDHTLSQLRTEYETEKKEEQIISLELEAQLEQLARERDKQIRILLIAVAALLVFLAIGLWNQLTFTRKSRAIIKKEKERSEELLLNILPQEVAEELKEKGEAEAQFIDHATVLFTDFKGFTAMSEQLSPQDLVNDLNQCFSEFDRITARYGIEKIKTIGDSYMAAGGLPTPNTTHATDVVRAAMEMRDFVMAGKAKKVKAGLPYFEIRIGIHSGPVVAGIVGVKKFQYDIWGDTVNTASRMENSGEVGRINISQATYDLLEEDRDLTFESRGKIQVKGKGEIEMYFVSKP